MKIFAICLVKNEVDILERVISEASLWADRIFIADHNSSDGTWELIKDKLSLNPQVQVYGQIFEDFNEGLRGKIYNKYKHLAKKGDWWCRLDSDEIYIDNPKLFLNKVSHLYNVVRGAKFQYYFTDVDVKKYDATPSLYLNGNCVDSLKYYVCNESETRFFRHLNTEWESNALWPATKWPHFIYKKHIRLKHFQYRYPEQMQTRIGIRSEIRKKTDLFSHEVRRDWSKRISNRDKIDQNNNDLEYIQTWKDRILDSQNLTYDDDVNYVITPELMTKKINPLLIQLIRNTLFVLLGRAKRISTR